MASRYAVILSTPEELTLEQVVTRAGYEMCASAEFIARIHWPTGEAYVYKDRYSHPRPVPVAAVGMIVERRGLSRIDL